MGRTEILTRHAEVSEKATERYLVEKVREAGGLCLKYSNAGMIGYPDRIVCMPGGKTAWVEIKSKGKKPARIQSARMEELAALGFDVRVIDSRRKVDEAIAGWRKRK